MRAFQFLLIVGSVASTLLVGRPAQCREPECAFSDEPFMTFFVLASSVAEYYAGHRAWPSSTQQLRVQLLQSAQSGPDLAAKPTKKDVDQFFTRFGRIDLQPRGRDLVLAAQYRAGGKSYSRRLLLHPGRNTDEMLQASSEVK
jgi:hypothetical protein